MEHKDPVAQTLTGVSQAPSAQVSSQSGGDVIDRLREFSEHAGALSRKNTHLVNALRTARQGLAALHEDVKALQPPPLTHATILAVGATTRTVDASIAGRRHRVDVGPAVVPSSLHPDDDVVLNEHPVITATCPSLRFGKVITVKETCDDGTTLVLAYHDEEQILSLSEALSDHYPRVGDILMADLAVRVALRSMVRSEIEEFVLEEVPSVGYGDIGGLGGQVELIRNAVGLPFLHPDFYREHQLTPSHGMLLYELPECDKTLIAKAVATSLGAGGRGGAYFLDIKGPQLLNKYVGETERRIRVTFTRTREKAATGVLAVVSFDEMDSLFCTRGFECSSDVEITVVPQILTKINGVDELDSAMAIGAINRGDMIDPAILRPGRLDTKIRIGRPDRHDAAEVLIIYLISNLPASGELLAAHGDAQGTVDTLIEQVIDALYTHHHATEIVELTRVDGELGTLHVAGLVNGAMLISIVDRAKKAAAKDLVINGRHGLTSKHLRRAVIEEILENEGLPATTHLDDWARINGRRDMPMVSMNVLQRLREE